MDRRLLDDAADVRRPTAPGRVDVWIAPVPAGAALPPPLLALLDDDDLERCRRLRRAPDRARFVVGRALLRTALARATGWSPREIRFAYGAAGKPRLEDDTTGIEFGLAHGGSAAAIALARALVGIDIEPVVALEPGAIAVALSASERATIEALPVAGRSRRTLRLWTMKEAYAKLVGRGVDLDLVDVDVAALERRSDLYLDAFEVTVAGGRFCVGLAVARPLPGPVSVRLIIEPAVPSHVSGAAEMRSGSGGEVSLTWA